MWGELGLDADEGRALIGAMRWVAEADGGLEERELTLLDVAASAIGHDLDARAVPACAPSEVASALQSPIARERALQSAILMALVDERVEPSESRAVRALADALEVPEPRVQNLAQLARGHTTLLMLDLARRSFARPIFERALKERGFAGLYRIVGPLIGLARDGQLAQRYIALGELPEGSFGRAYFDFLVRNDLGFPGEDHAVPEAGVWHDLTHVLAGYETTDREEVQVVCFIAGYRRDDPFFWIFTIALQYHLGLKVSPYSPQKRGLFDPGLAMAAYERGRCVGIDLERWDPWPHFARPLEEVRAELSVPPR